MHISIGAVCLVLLIGHLFNAQIPSNYLWFIFSSTLFIYGLHRIVGIQKTYDLEKKGRYHIVYEYKHHIRIYTIASFLGSIYFFFQLPLEIYPYLILTAVISVLYTMPILGKSKRLRDFNYIKLLLIALVWSLTTAFIPSLLLQLSWLTIVLISLDRFFFFIAITIPFDIRDATIDEKIQVKTIAHVFGKSANLRLAIFSLCISTCLIFVLYINSLIDIHAMSSLILAYFVCSLLIYRSKNIDSDYYYTGVLDGTMILIYLIVGLVDAVVGG